MKRNRSTMAAALAAIAMTLCLAGCSNDSQGAAGAAESKCRLTFPINEQEKTEYNTSIFEIEPFDIQFQLPEGWSIGDYNSQTTNYLCTGVWSRVGVYDASGTCVGAVGYNIYDTNEVVEGEPMSIYSQIALGNHYQFNVRETYTVIKETDRYQTATVDVYSDSDFLGEENGAESTIHYGILSHERDLGVYVAFEFDNTALSNEQIAQIADSVEFT